MSTFTLALAALTLGSVVQAQQAGTLTPEKHPPLSVSTCSAGGTCTSKTQSVVLDGNWRWLHSTSGSTNCYTGNTWDKTLCPDGATCAKNCALDGADYPGTYGIKASGNALSLQFKTGSNVGSRVYLMNEADTAYQTFDLRNKEFTFDVDVSQLGCKCARPQPRKSRKVREKSKDGRTVEERSLSPISCLYIYLYLRLCMLVRKKHNTQPLTLKTRWSQRCPLLRVDACRWWCFRDQQGRCQVRHWLLRCSGAYLEKCTRKI